jgi:hypothetical protein
VEQIYLLIGGDPVAHDLPLNWAVQEQLDKGVIGRVNADGTPWEPERPARRTAKSVDK